MSEFYNTVPKGAGTQNLDAAPLANNESSETLVKNNEHDAFYFRSLEAKGIKLNKPQIEAVRHFKGPALILAGAGSGKTRVLTSRAGYLISIHEVNPKNILLVTFTKKAAEEMKERIAGLPGLSRKMAGDIKTSTFHSLFLEILRSQGYNQKILSSKLMKQIAIKKILRKMDLQDAYEPETLLATLSAYKNNMMSVYDMPSKTSVEKEVKEVLIDYEDWKFEQNFIDYDDMLLQSYYLLNKHQSLLNVLQNRLKYILCDEWQDSNPIQYELIKMIARPSNNLFVVGDDDQGIYRFNGADNSIILNFDKDYPDTKVITLDVNYRSNAHIIGLANKLISFNKIRHPKTLKAFKSSDQKPFFLRPESTNIEAKLIIENINSDVLQGKRKYKDFAILHRTNSSSRAMFDQLVYQDIPFISYHEGEVFYEQSIVKPVIDYLRLSLSPRDYEAISGIMPSLYLNREKAIDYVKRQDFLSPKEKPLHHLVTYPSLKDFQVQQLIERFSIVERLKDMLPVEAVREIRKFYDKYMEADDRKTLTLHKEIVKETLAEVESSAVQFKSVSDYIQFIDRIIAKNKEMKELRKNPEANAISLMTIHKSKGLEFPVIYLIGASESLLPHSSALEDCEDVISDKNGSEKVAAAIEEERRLAYVGVTRAQEELYISSPENYRGFSVEVSRFFLEAFKEEEGKEAVSKPKTVTRIDLVWECSNTTCSGWMRITTKEEAERQQRYCPLCRADMYKTDKEVEVSR